jgi:hypothetical protein
MSQGGDTFKVVEVSPVSEDTLERALNDWTREGWSFQSLHFVGREGSHRPALAYLFFVRAGQGKGRTAAKIRATS